MKNLLLALAVSLYLCSPISKQSEAKPVELPVEVVQIQQVAHKLQPKLTDKESLQVAKAVYKHSQKFNLDWRLVLSVLNQESSLRKDPQNCLKNKKACTGDYGVGQVRKKVWDRMPGMKFDDTKLLTDYDYAIYATTKVLNHYKEHYSYRELNWYTRYHSGTPEFRAAYMKSLNKSYAKINRHLGNVLLQNLPMDATIVGKAY